MSVKFNNDTAGVRKFATFGEFILLHTLAGAPIKRSGNGIGIGERACRHSDDSTVFRLGYVDRGDGLWQEPDTTPKHGGPAPYYVNGVTCDGEGVLIWSLIRCY